MEKFVIILYEQGKPLVEIVWNKDGLTITGGDTLPSHELKNKPPYELRIFIDRSLLEVFINNVSTITCWLDGYSVDEAILSAEKGTIDLEEIRIWRIKETE